MEHHKTEQYFIFELLGSALNQTSWDTIPEGLDWKYVYTLCKYHKIDNLAAYALDYADTTVQEQIPENVRQIFLLAKQKGIAREATQFFSLEEMQKEFEENRIYNIPLKGAQLKSYYPSPDMRFLTDLDILCHREDAEKISEIMTGLGYRMEHGGGHHDVYVREPFMTVEIHWICSTNNASMNALFENIWERCSNWEGYEYSRRMPWEDYYVYMVGHMAKHFRYGGIGLRMLLDFYVFERRLQENCDWQYVECHLKEAKLFLFVQTMSSFLKKCFRHEELTSEEQLLLEHIWENGAYGTKETHSGIRFLKDGGSKGTIWKNRILIYIHVLFPPSDGMKQMYPYLKKYPFLLPAAWFQRLMKKTLFERQKSREVWKDAGNTDNLDKMNKICRAAGLY